jgi:hypothetical protein
MRKFIFASFILVSLTLWDCLAVQFDASVPPKGAFYFKIYPEIFVTSARFDNSGKSINLPDISQFSYVDTQTEFHYGLTDTLMAGVLLPIEYVRKTYTVDVKTNDTRIGNPWLIITHQFWSEVVTATSSLRVKLPITDIESMEAGFDLDDKQVDIYPVYYFDWMMSIGTYINSQIGYKYRMKNNQIKPSDELRLIIETGYAIVPAVIRIFTYSDFIKFFSSKIDGQIIELSKGYIYTIGAGVRFFLGQNLRIEVLTNATPFGKNRFRGIGGHAGIGFVFGM